MLGALLILVFAIFLAFFEPVLASRKLLNKDNTKKYDAEIKKLWTIAKDSMNSRKTLRAEKALLTILKLDETNAAAYNRLGILYAKAQNYDEAIECFEIAQYLLAFLPLQKPKKNLDTKNPPSKLLNLLTISINQPPL